MNINTAHILASASQAVYLDEPEVENWASDRGFDEFSWFDTHDTQAAIMADDDRCILAFRGTSSLQDWLTDFDVFKSLGPYGQVHHGFQEALDAIWSDLLEYIVETHGDKELFVTGHSLGAALATLTTARLGYGRLYTFGSPRVGDDTFAKNFDYRHESYRFVNNNDIVTRLPMAGYQHISSLRHFTVKGKMWVEPSFRWIEWDRFLGRLRRIAADGVKDHNIGDYVSLVAQQ